MITIRLENTTGWKTEDLRRVIKAAAEHRGYDVSGRHTVVQTCRARYKHRRPASHLYSGRATLNGARAGRRDVYLGVPPLKHYRSADRKNLDDPEDRGAGDFEKESQRTSGMEVWYNLKCRYCGVRKHFVVDAYDFDGHDAVERVTTAEDLSSEEVIDYAGVENNHSCKEIDVEFDVERFAQVVLHELDHSFQGLKHKDMLKSSELDTPFVDDLQVRKARGDDDAL